MLAVLVRLPDEKGDVADVRPHRWRAHPVSVPAARPWQGPPTATGHVEESASGHQPHDGRVAGRCGPLRPTPVIFCEDTNHGSAQTIADPGRNRDQP